MKTLNNSVSSSVSVWNSVRNFTWFYIRKSAWSGFIDFVSQDVSDAVGYSVRDSVDNFTREKFN